MEKIKKYILERDDILEIVDDIDIEFIDDIISDLKDMAELDEEYYLTYDEKKELIADIKEYIANNDGEDPWPSPMDVYGAGGLGL